MQATKSSGRESRIEPVRWTVEQAASEFGINPRTLSSRIKTQGIEKGNDGKFSTLDICRAIFNDYEKERTRKITEEANGFALDNAARRGQLADKADLMSRYETIWSSMRATILNSSLTQVEKDALIDDLGKLHAL